MQVARVVAVHRAPPVVDEPRDGGDPGNPDRPIAYATGTFMLNP